MRWHEMQIITLYVTSKPLWITTLLKDTQFES